ncbi:MAG: hypothetical protein HPY44_02685 [Armatimonadetes bacterium]|nr:hypothetical protein [Armatimonadota bacterium]
MANPVQDRIDRIRAAINLRRPDRLPCGDFAWAEYRPEVYHLEEPEPVSAIGQVAVSADGKTRYTKDGGTWAVGDREKYRDHEDVLAVAPDTFEVEQVRPEMISHMTDLFAAAQERGYPAPLHYGTLVTRATLEFGWEPFLTASALAPERFGRILDRFAEATLAVIQGWLEVPGVELIVIHDDIAGTRGVLMSPGWYRRYVFPWYARFFAEIHDRGCKVLYMSDGNYLPVLQDILAAGADGLYIESSSMDPGEFMRAAGKDRFFLLKTDNRNIDVGTPEDIRQELENLRELHTEFPGITMYRGGGNPSPANAEAFTRYYNEYLVYA